MITYPSSVLDLLEQGRTRVRGLIQLDLGSGTYGFIKRQTKFVYSGVTYLPGGIIQVSDLGASTDMVAQQFTLTLAASPDTDLTPEVLQTIEAEDYRDRPVTISDAHFHPDTDALLLVQRMKRGYIDTIDHSDDPKSGYQLIVSCEGRELDYSRTNGRKRSNADQQRRSEGDLFLEHASIRGRVKVFWGQASTKNTDEDISRVYRNTVI